jgi:hypothetical protein
MITSATSMPVTSDLKDTQSELIPQYCWAPCRIQQAQTLDNSPGGAIPLFAGNQITAGEFNEYRPSISVDASGRFFIAFDGTEDGTTYYPFVTYSEDEGVTWADPGYWPESADAKKPDVDFNAHGFYGTFDPPVASSGDVWIIDASDLGNILGGSWPWGDNGFDSLEDLHIGTYTHPGPEDDGAWNWGGLAFVGYNGYSGNDIVGCPFLMYQYNLEGYALIGWLNNAAGCEHASIDIDQLKNFSYSAYDRPVTGKYQILVRKDNFGAWNYNAQYDYWSHPYVTAKSVIGVGNLTYPDIIAENNKVLVVAQSDEAGNQDIVCYYSSNGMSSYNDVIVSNGAEDELSPQVTWIKEGVAVCTYQKGNEAYFRSSIDYGATWSDEARVSDEELEPIEDHAITIAGVNGNSYAIWQDGRGDNVDIYWDLFYTVSAPNVQIGAIGGGVGKVTMEVKNIGTGAASNVPWTISVKGGILGRINVTTSDVIASLSAGGAQTVQTNKFIFGFGTITIQLTAGAATASKTGKVLLILVRGIT